MENELHSVLQYLLSNPVFLVPILGVAAMAIYGILKKLIKTGRGAWLDAEMEKLLTVVEVKSEERRSVKMTKSHF